MRACERESKRTMAPEVSGYALRTLFRRLALWGTLTLPAAAWAGDTPGSLPETSTTATNPPAGPDVARPPAASRTDTQVTLSPDGMELRIKEPASESQEEAVKFTERGYSLLTRGPAAYVQHRASFSIVRILKPRTLVRQVFLPLLRKGWGWVLTERHLIIENSDGSRTAYRVDNPLELVVAEEGEAPSVEVDERSRFTGALVPPKQSNDAQRSWVPLPRGVWTPPPPPGPLTLAIAGGVLSTAGLAMHLAAVGILASKSYQGPDIAVIALSLLVLPAATLTAPGATMLTIGARRSLQFQDDVREHRRTIDPGVPNLVTAQHGIVHARRALIAGGVITGLGLVGFAVLGGSLAALDPGPCPITVYSPLSGNCSKLGAQYSTAWGTLILAPILTGAGIFTLGIGLDRYLRYNALVSSTSPSLRVHLSPRVGVDQAGIALTGLF
jgi:hypothetical protein